MKSQPPTNSSPFLQLPFELRLQIYMLVTDTTQTRAVTIEKASPLTDPAILPPAPFAAAIGLQTPPPLNSFSLRAASLFHRAWQFFNQTEIMYYAWLRLHRLPKRKTYFGVAKQMPLCFYYLWMKPAQSTPVSTVRGHIALLLVCKSM